MLEQKQQIQQLQDIQTEAIATELIKTYKTHLAWYNWGCYNEVQLYINIVK